MTTKATETPEATETPGATKATKTPGATKATETTKTTTNETLKSDNIQERLELILGILNNLEDFGDNRDMTSLEQREVINFVQRIRNKFFQLKELTEAESSFAKKLINNKRIKDLIADKKEDRKTKQKVMHEILKGILRELKITLGIDKKGILQVIQRVIE